MITACSPNPPNDNWSGRRDVLLHCADPSGCTPGGFHQNHCCQDIIAVIVMVTIHQDHNPSLL